MKLEVGDSLRCGVIGKGITNNAIIENIDCKGNRFGISINLGDENSLCTSPKQQIEVVLAVPRPLRLERILPVISSLGVSKLFLTGAEKVEKQYFGTLILEFTHISSDFANHFHLA